MNKIDTASTQPLKKTSKGRPAQAKVEQNKQDLLKTALTVFQEKGYTGSSIDEIARRAKVSRNTIYLQYGNKENLFTSAAQYGQACLDVQFDSLVDDDTKFEDVLLRIIERVQKLWGEPQVRDLTRLLIAESQLFPTLANAMLDDLNTKLKPITRYIESHLHNKGVSPNSPYTAALDIIMLALGGFVFLLSEPSHTPQELKQRALDIRNLMLNGWYVSQ